MGWSLIAGHLPGRTDNEIKNHWNSHLSRRASDFRLGGNGVIVNVNLSKLPGGGKRRGGRTSRGGNATAAKGAKKKNAKGKEKEKTAEVMLLHEVKKGQEKDTDAPTPSYQPRHDQIEEHASASGVTSDGLESDGPLGLNEEMVSAPLGHASPKLEMGPDGACVDHKIGLCMDSDGWPRVQSGSGPDGLPSGDVAQELGDNKALEDWDLTELDLAVDHDVWNSLAWNYDDMVDVVPQGGQQGELVPDLFFLDNM